jgi:plastocyanin
MGLPFSYLKGDNMKKLMFALVVLMLVFASGCATKNVQTSVEPQPVPQLKTVQPAPETKEAPAAPVAPETTKAPIESKYTNTPSQESGEADTLGSRVQGTEQTSPDVAVPLGDIEIKLTPEKTMNASSMIVKAGTTLFWKNYDKNPHVLAVESGKGLDTKRWAKSEQILNSAVWKYTFESKGDFVVRDLFSGAMRMNVTVE